MVALAKASCSPETTLAGVFAGAKKAYHSLGLNCAKPSSFIVGTSGSTGTRSSDVTPSNLTLPDFASESASAVEGKNNWTWFPSRA